MRLAETPHYLMFSESTWSYGRSGRWRFCLEAVGDGRSFEAADEEPAPNRDRLELLAVVRGLESLDQPSRITLVTASRYVSRGFRSGLPQWRRQNWCWEYYGDWTRIRDADLWRRIDGALRYHEVRCRLWKGLAETRARSADRVTPLRAATGGGWFQRLREACGFPLGKQRRLAFNGAS